MALQEGKINLVMDGQWGSCGKGKIAGYLALRDRPYASVCNFATNAGHTFRDKVIGTFMVQQLPMAAINPDVQLYISAGAAITLPTLLKEIAMFEDAGIPIRNRLSIDRHAMIIMPEHKEQEQKNLVRISSTVKGVGAAQAAKIMRQEGVVLAKHCKELTAYIVEVSELLDRALDAGLTVLGELAQGFDLSLNHGFYPYVTSRDVTPMAFMNDIGVPAKRLGNVYGVLRTYPIRVGDVVIDNTRIGYSGPIYNDQTEYTWEQMAQMSGIEGLSETTSVTGKVRRVFSWSTLQFCKFLRVCDPTHLVLNFCNYYKGISANTKYWRDIVDTQQYKDMGVDDNVFSMFGTGADNAAIIDLENY